MTTQEINIQYQVYKSVDEMNPEDRELVAEAVKAMQGAFNANVEQIARVTGLTYEAAASLLDSV